MTRWRMRCVSLDGRVQHEALYLFRRSAVADAQRLASPLYDVLVEHVKGRHRPMLWPHTPPSELLR